ncbi:MAG: hypothetical protein H6710_16570 [Myxococcales bacterium]|nr:hypothetical protein [Myxococcales bacterium]
MIEALAAGGGRRRPLGAIVALVDAPALLGGDPAALGEALRRRIDEVQAGLGVVTPITLVVAKVDALVGFARLAELVGADALGLTLEVAGPGADAARGVVERELRALVDDLGRAAFDALDRAPGAEARGEVLRGARGDRAPRGGERRPRGRAGPRSRGRRRADPPDDRLGERRRARASE